MLVGRARRRDGVPRRSRRGGSGCRTAGSPPRRQPPRVSDGRRAASGPGRKSRRVGQPWPGRARRQAAARPQGGGGRGSSTVWSGGLVDPASVGLSVDGGAGGEDDPMRRLPFSRQGLEKRAETLDIGRPVGAIGRLVWRGRVDDDVDRRRQPDERRRARQVGTERADRGGEALGPRRSPPTRRPAVASSTPSAVPMSPQPAIRIRIAIPARAHATPASRRPHAWSMARSSIISTPRVPRGAPSPPIRSAIRRGSRRRTRATRRRGAPARGRRDAQARGAGAQILGHTDDLCLWRLDAEVQDATARAGEDERSHLEPQPVSLARQRRQDDEAARLAWRLSGEAQGPRRSARRSDRKCSCRTSSRCVAHASPTARTRGTTRARSHSTGPSLAQSARSACCNCPAANSRTAWRRPPARHRSQRRAPSPPPSPPGASRARPRKRAPPRLPVAPARAPPDPAEARDAGKR